MRSSKNVSLMYDDLVTPSFTDLLNNVGNDIKSIKHPPIFLCLLKFISDKGSQRKNTILFIYPYSPFSFFSCSSSITKNRRGNEIPIRVFHNRIESKFRKKKEKRGRRNNSTGKYSRGQSRWHISPTVRNLSKYPRSFRRRCFIIAISAPKVSADFHGYARPSFVTSSSLHSKLERSRHRLNRDYSNAKSWLEIYLNRPR